MGGLFPETAQGVLTRRVLLGGPKGVFQQPNARGGEHVVHRRVAHDLVGGHKDTC